MTQWVAKINKLIAFSFYALFFLVPLAMWNTTYELFEFNKMWISFGISLLIASLWIAKSLVTREFFIRRTPLDLPILLFLLSQIVSTIFSIDPYTSFWGYYSRFNGGLLSILCYIFLYYAFASNLYTEKDKDVSKIISYRVLVVSLLSGVVVALWGLPSHFGYDPTCLVFRGEFNVKCWNDAFQPKVRIFSTLGQPNWLAAYLAILLPIALSFLLIPFFTLRERLQDIKSNHLSSIREILLKRQNIFLVILIILFFFDLIFTRSRSGFYGFGASMIVFVVLLCWHYVTEKIRLLLSTTGVTLFLFWMIYEWKDISLLFIITIVLFIAFLAQLFYGLFSTKDEALKPAKKIITGIVLLILGISLLFGTPVTSKLTDIFSPSSQTAQKAPTPVPETTGTLLETGGTDSGKIRLIVWRGAFEIFKNNPIIGTGVETFAYAYYKVKPLEHNLTSEWDYLYNKAHNEYLNYLATTGILGFGTYMLFIGAFLYKAAKRLLFERKDWPELPIFYLLSLCLLASFISILISNFFGFSVVIVNLYFFLIPILFFELSGFTMDKRLFTLGGKKASTHFSGIQMISLIILGIAFLFYELMLLRYWIADTNYAVGYNLNKFGGVEGYVQAQEPLMKAYLARPSEHLFKNELSINIATLALLYKEQNQASQASLLAQQAEQLSNEVAEDNPYNVVYFKTRTRVFYALSEIEPKYFEEAIKSIERSEELAPTDAKISYNKALLYNQKGEKGKAIEALEKTIKLKPNYIEAYSTLALYYQEASVKNPDKSIELRKKAQETAEFVIKNLDPENLQAKEVLEKL